MTTLLTNNQTVEEETSEANSLSQILYWIEFRTENQRNLLITDSFTSFNDLQNLDDKEIEKMRGDFATRSTTAGKIIFGTNRTKRIKALIHWLMDFYRISSKPSIVGLNEVTFQDKLRLAVTRASIRKTLAAQA